MCSMQKTHLEHDAIVKTEMNSDNRIRNKIIDTFKFNESEVWICHAAAKYAKNAKIKRKIRFKEKKRCHTKSQCDCWIKWKKS